MKQKIHNFILILTTTMKVKTIRVKNIKAITETEVDFNGCTAIITGWNNKWKSTLLKSLPDRIRGIKPEQIVKIWETEWSAEWELTDGSKIQWKIDEKGKETFIYILPNGLEVKDWVLKFLQDKYFGDGFDIDKFLLATPKEQTKMLQKIIGEWIEEAQEEYKKAYSDRTEKNSILKNEKAKAIESDMWDVPLQEKDIISLQTSIRQANDKNQDYNSLIQTLAEKQNKLDHIDKEIARLQWERSLVEWAKKSLEERAKTMEKIDVSKLEIELAEAIEYNKKVLNHNNILRQWVSLDVAQKNWDEADAKVKELEQKIKDIMAKSPLPEWLTIDEDWVKYRWLPLSKEQLSSSAVYIVALKLGSLWMGALKTLFFDASYLDKNSLDEIQEWAEKSGFQLLIERPDYEGWEISYKIIEE